MKPKIIVIVGPTASGKSALGKEIAKRFCGEIISVDSRQIYQGMDIGTAKEIGDKGTDIVSPDKNFTAAQFKTFATKEIVDIIKRKHIPILVGGSGLWMQAIIDNMTLAKTPPNPSLRLSFENQSLSDLTAELIRLDPQAKDIIDLQNRRRVVRALEVCIQTKKPFSQSLSRGESMYEILELGMLVPKDALITRINKRVDEMMRQGFISEVIRLRKQFPNSPLPLYTIGYKELGAHLDGQVTIEQAAEKIKIATRQYAKRQITWFKRDKRIHWVTGTNEAIALVDDFLQNT